MSAEMLLHTDMRTAFRKDSRMPEKNIIISIGRECGSGGHEIGEKLAEHFGIKLYDRNIVTMLAERTNQDPKELEKLEERVSGQFFHLLRRNGFASQEGSLMNKLSKSDLLYMQEKALIQEFEEKESFVIIGRAANAILKDTPNVLKLFLYAPEEFKLPRVMDFYHLDSKKEARKTMEHIDKVRTDYFHYYSDMTWGSKDGHHVMIDTSVFGIDGTFDIITDIAKRKFGLS